MPIKRHVKQIVWLLLVVTVVVAALAYVQAQALSAVRAYVHGESLWAKAQKDAVLQLYTYLNSPEATTYQAFERALQVNLSYRQARLAMQMPTPDWAVARQGFLAAGSHPDDIDNMIRLFLWFGDVHYMKQAIAIWQKGDRRIDQLQALVARLHANRQTASPQMLATYQAELDQLNQQLHALEIAFSVELGKGARWIGNTVVLTNFAMLLVILLVIGAIARNVIGEIDQTESRLRESESRLRALHDADLIGIILWGMNGELYDANDAFLNLLGYSRAELEQGNLNWMQLTPPESLQNDERALQQVAERGYCEPFSKEFLHRSGRPVAVLVGGALISDRQNQGMAFVLDRSKERQLEDQLRLSATVLEASLDGILICDLQHRVLTANDAYCAMTGQQREVVIGALADFCLPDDSDEAERIQRSLETQGSWQGDTAIVRSGGHHLPVRISVSAVKTPTGAISHYVAVFTDISVRQALERNLKNRAHYDPLTGLANRSLLSDRLETALVRAQRGGKYCAVLFVDLDRFKPVNDQYGHAVGDQLLRLVAQRLKSAIRESDTLARLGGDEFIAIVEGLEELESAPRIAQSMIEALAQPFSVDTHKIALGCSIGISFFPQHGSNAIALMRTADIAMYQAKTKTDGHWYIYQDNN